MELKWLEDLVAVAQEGHFSRAAESRHVTQSALSRRIQALELWAGAELLDRSQHPIRLTPEGEDFIQVARDIVGRSYEIQASIAASGRIAKDGVRVACLHTLALDFLPAFVARLQKEIGAFEMSIVAETRTIEEYLGSLTTGTSDLFVCYHHPAVTFDIDPASFPSIEIGRDIMAPFGDARFVEALRDETATAPVPYLQFSATSFMSHVVRDLVMRARLSDRLRPVYRASLAESLISAARHGLGLGWMPKSLVGPDADAMPDMPESWTTPMVVRAYRARNNSNRTLARIWDAIEQGPVVGLGEA